MDIDESVKNDLQTVRDWLRWAATQFVRGDVYFGHGTDNPWDEAAQLVLWVLATPWQKLEHILDARLTMQERQEVINAVEKRVKHRMPLPYITGIAHFAGLEFEVNEFTLIPRSPISELIERQFQPWMEQPPLQILDLCCGGGCIGIACAAYIEDSEVWLSDISAEALEVAERNVARYELQDRCGLIQADLFTGMSQTFDLIVSNPPYVDAEDMANLPEEFKVEPELALASGTDGLDFTRRLLREAHQYLNDNGLIIVEVGNSAIALQEAYPNVPFVWLEFERGGEGVFALSKEQLVQFAEQF